MPSNFVFKNGSKAEGAAHTIGIDNVEVPDSATAKKCFVVRAEIDLTLPTHVAASETQSDAIFMTGKLTPTSANLSEQGAITGKRHTRASNGTANYAVITEGPDQAQGRWEIFRNPDGKFYFTIAVLGSSGCTGVMTCNYRADFELEV